MYINNKKTIFKFFWFALLFIGFRGLVFANDEVPKKEGKVDFVTIEQVNIGIANQLEFLIDYNKNNEKKSKGQKNWYVYVVGNDQFDKNVLLDEYVQNELDLTDIGTANTPVDIAELNKKLIEINDKLKSAVPSLPLLYYGVANRKKAIVAPFFPFSDKYKVSSATPKEIREYYKKAFDNPLENENSQSAGKTYDVLKEFHKEGGVYSTSKSELLVNTLNKSGNKGAIALSRYYYAFIKQNKDGTKNTAKVKWWSSSSSKKSTQVPEIDADLFKAHAANLASTSGDSNHKRINIWYNYLVGTDLPESQFLKEILKGMIDNSVCTNLSTTDGENQKSKFEAAVNSEDIEAIVKETHGLCSSVLQNVDYSVIIKAIKTITKENIKEKQEAVILHLLHNIKSKDYASLFKDFKEKENTLLKTLLKEMDDRSINPFDGDNYTSFLGELLYICNQDNAAYLIKERDYLVDVLYEYFNSTAGDVVRPYYVVPSLKKIISFNPNEIDSEFHNYLKGSDNEYKNLFKILEVVTSNVNSEHIKEDLRVFGDSLGEIFATMDDQEAFVKMLDISFFTTPSFLAMNEPQRQVVQALTFRMFNNIPKSTDKIYKFLIGGEKPLDNFKKIIKNSNNNDYNLYADVFYDGVTKILSSNDDVNTRIELAKWAIEKDSSIVALTNIEEQLVANVFKNLSNINDKKAVYNFLTYKNGDASTKDKDFEYLKKCTDKGVLSSSKLLGAFISDYAKLLSEDGIGEVQDRLDLLNYAINKGDDTIFINDSESLIGYIFDNLGDDFEDAEVIIKALKADNYTLFSKVWKILASSGLTEIFNTDNRYATNFIVQLSKIMQSAYGDPKKDLPKGVEKIRLKKINYLSAEVSKIDEISIDKETERYFPMARNGIFTDNVEGSRNQYEYSSNILLTENSASVSVNLNIVDYKGEEIQVIETNKLGPLDFVIVEFIEDTKITNQVEFERGTLIAVPAMYLAWMSNSINAQQNEVVGRVMLDAVVVAGSIATIIPSGGTSVAFATKFLAGAEIVFATTDAIIAINEDELKEALGKDFIEGIETTNMIFGIATLPTALPGIVKITQKGFSVATDLAKTGMKFVDDIPSFKGYKIDIDGAQLLKSLKKIKAETPVKFKDEFTKVQNLLAKQRIKISNAPASVKTLYNQTVAFTKSFYLANATDAFRATINALPSERLQQTIVNKLLVYSFDGKTIFKLSPEGVLQDIKLFKEAANYNEVVGSFETSVLVKGKVYKEFVEVVVVKDYKGAPLFRPKFENNFTRSSDLINELHIRSANSPPYMDGTDVLDYTINKGDKFYVVEYADRAGQPVPGGFGSKEPISSIEELRNKLAVLESWKDPTQNGGVVVREYEALQPIKTRSGDIGPQTEISGPNTGEYYRGGGHQYEFVDNWRAIDDWKAYMKELKSTKLLANSVDEFLDGFVGVVRRGNADELADATTKIADHRTLINKPSSGNFGYIEGNINGSAVDNKLWSSGPADLISEPQIFDAVEVGGWVRNTDSEFKMLNKQTDILGGVKGNSYPNVTGEIKIVSERAYCTSCQGVLQQFSEMFPNLKLILVDGVR